MKTFIKDPYADKDYTFDWSAWLGTDELASVAFEVGTGLTLSKIVFEPDKAHVWVAGGTEGQSVIVSCKVETVGERKDKKSVLFIIQQE